MFDVLLFFGLILSLDLMIYVPLCFFGVNSELGSHALYVPLFFGLFLSLDLMLYLPLCFAMRLCCLL